MYGLAAVCITISHQRLKQRGDVVHPQPSGSLWPEPVGHSGLSMFLMQSAEKPTAVLFVEEACLEREETAVQQRCCTDRFHREING